jgi:hypothetical protein
VQTEVTVQSYQESVPYPKFVRGRHAGRVGNAARTRDPEEAASSQRPISLTGTSNLALLVGVIAVSAVIENSAVKPRGLLSRLLT